MWGVFSEKSVDFLVSFSPFKPSPTPSDKADESLPARIFSYSNRIFSVVKSSGKISIFFSTILDGTTIYSA